MNVYALIPAVAAAIYIGLLSATVAHRPWNRRHRVFVWFLAGALLWSLSNVLFRFDGFYEYKLLLAKITVCSFALTMVPFCYFIETFYHQRRGGWIWLAWAPLVMSIALAAAGILPTRVEESLTFYPVYDLWWLVLSMALPYVILAVRGLYFLTRGIILAENPALHNRLIYLVATVVILSVTVVSNFSVIGRQLPIGHVGNLLVAILLAYATFRHKLVDVKVVIRSGLVYGGLAFVAAVSYLLLLYGAQQWFHSVFEVPALVLAITLAVLMAVSLIPLQKLLQRGADQILFPGRYDYRKTLVSFSKKAAGIIKMDELGRELTGLVAGAVGAKRAFLLLPDGSGRFVAQFVMPETGDQVEPLALAADSPILESLAGTREPLFRETLEIRPEFTGIWKEESRAIQVSEVELFVPLITRGGLVGVLALARKDPLSSYDLSDIDLIRLLTNETAIAIENAQLHARIEAQAITDGLTKLFNRRYFDQRLSEEIGRCSRYGGRFTLALMDLDRFKVYNDTYGHTAGDVLLEKTAGAIRENLRNVDLAFRYGGDEFAVILPSTPREGAAIAAERMRASIWQDVNGGSTPVAISIGLAAWPDDATAQGDLVRAADKALYQAKRDGGDRVSLYAKTLGAATISTEPVSQTEREALGTIYALAAAVEAKDPYTYGHSRKVSRCCVALAETLQLPKQEIETIGAASILHDIGKIGIPDDLLKKTGPLSGDEWKIIRTHPKLGAAIISHVSSLSNLMPGVLYHHERFDGSGYPEGISGEAIPLHARIMAIADAFSAMTAARPYREALPHERVVDELRKGAGTQFDPSLVKRFLEIVDQIPY
jgi:diguanylate cyclase (GGDEF)-like protein